jgi:protein AroM
VADSVAPTEDDPVFVTRLRDGSEVTVDRAAVGELLRERVAEVAADVGAVGVLCTGALPPFDAAVPVLKPSALLRAWADAVADDGPVGMLVPKSEQVSQVEEKWAGREVVAAAASPYEEGDRVAAAAAEVAGADPEVVVMDCIGYTPSMKRTVRETTDTGVLLGRSVLAKTVTELL